MGFFEFFYDFDRAPKLQHAINSTKTLLVLLLEVQKY